MPYLTTYCVVINIMTIQVPTGALLMNNVALYYDQLAKN